MRIDGLAGLDKALEKAAETTRQQAEAAIAAEVKATRDDVRRTVPVDSGQLRDSVRTRQEDLVGEVHITARHAEFVEFGTSSTRAQPYAAPAAARARLRLPKRVAQMIRVAVER